MSPDPVTPRLCRLCQTPIGGRPGATDIFCCAGCEKVFDVLGRLDEGAKGAYIEAARRLGLIPGAPAPATPTRSPEATPTALKTERLAVSGLVCPSCGWVAGEVLASGKGVARATVDYFTGTAEVTYDLTKTSVDDLHALLSPLGYDLTPLSDEVRTAASRHATLVFVVVAILAMNVMSLSFLRYFRQLGRLDALPAFLPWLEAALTLPILALGWLPTLKRATQSLLFRRLTMDLLIAIGVGAAATLSAFSLVTGRGDMYFETAAGLVAISLLSRMIEARLRDSASFALTSLMRMPVVRLRKIDETGAERYVDIADIHQGDEVRFLPREMVPVDGEVLDGDALVSEAMLTGEPTPVAKRPGDLVSAGATVTEGMLQLAVTRRFDETLLSRIAKSIGETLLAQEGRLRQADRIASRFIPAVLAVALGAWLVRWGVHGLAFALSPAGWFPSVAVLAVACPCAFSLAGISAVTAVTGALLKKGFLVKELAALDALHRINHVIFDKTGTLTKGAMTADRLVWRDAADPALLRALFLTEHRSGHPAAAAIRAYLLAQGISPTGEAARDIEDRQGLGRIARLDGRTLCVGSAALFDDPFEPDALSPGHTAVWFGWEGRAAGCFLLTDEVRQSAAGTVAALSAMGISSELVSGDREEVTRHVADQIGISKAKGHAAIQDKIEIVRARRAEGKRVAFVGDGTNDALAMGEAHLSIALAKSTDEALAVSGIIALKGDINRLAELFELGRRLKRVVTENYIWAFAFNTLFIPVAALGKLVPLAAMLLMAVSSIAVLLNAMRLGSST